VIHERFGNVSIRFEMLACSGNLQTNIIITLFLLSILHQPYPVLIVELRVNPNCFIE
jgi:hypothetical protein